MVFLAFKLSYVTLGGLLPLIKNYCIKLVTKDVLDFKNEMCSFYNNSALETGT